MCGGLSSAFRVGQQCLTIGNPFGFDHTLTVGVISGLNRDIFSKVGVTIEDGVHFNKKQSAFLYNLEVQSLPKSHHYFFIRLKLEYFKISSLDSYEISACKFNHPKHKYYVILSKKIIAASVVMNLTVSSSKEPGSIVFHILTGAQNFYAMKLWVARNIYKETYVYVINYGTILMWQPAEFNPLQFNVVYCSEGYTGYAVVLFTKDWNETNPYGKYIYGWLAKEEDYKYGDPVGGFLSENGDLKAMVDLEHDLFRKTNNLTISLTNQITAKSKYLLDLECKCNQMNPSLQMAMEESDLLHERYNEEMRNMQFAAREHSQRIFQETGKLRKHLEEKGGDIHRRSKQLNELVAQTDMGRRKLAKTEKYRVENLHEGSLDDIYATAIRNCDLEGSLMLNISKMISVPDKGRFFAFGSVFSKEVATGKRDLYAKNVQSSAIWKGKKQESVENVPCGNTFVMVGLDRFITKNTTLTNEKEIDACQMKAMKFSVSFVVHVVVQYKVASDLPKLVVGLKSLAKSDPIVLYIMEEFGEHIGAGVGELLLAIGMKVHSLTMERVTYGFSAGDWVRHKEEDQKRSQVGILHSIDRNGTVYVGLIRLDTFWKGGYSDLQVVEAYCVGQFVRLEFNISNPHFEWQRKSGGGFSTDRISQILPNGCLVVKLTVKFSLGEVWSCLADPYEVEVVSLGKCEGIVKKYEHLEDFHWAVRLLLITIGLITAMRLGIFVGKSITRPKSRKVASVSDQGGDHQQLHQQEVQKQCQCSMAPSTGGKHTFLRRSCAFWMKVNDGDFLKYLGYATPQINPGCAYLGLKLSLKFLSCQKLLFQLFYLDWGFLIKYLRTSIILRRRKCQNWVKTPSWKFTVILEGYRFIYFS